MSSSEGPDERLPHVEVGDELHYRSMGGSVVAEVVEVRPFGYLCDNNVTVPPRAILEVNP